MKVKPYLTKGRVRPEVKRNKWVSPKTYAINTGSVAETNGLVQFQIDTEEIQDFREELQLWKTCGGLEHRPPPLIIEIFIDTSRLSKGQCLVVIDDNGKRWDVSEALSVFASSSDSPAEAQRRRSEVLLERWRIELKGSSMSDADDFGPILPTIYKKSIIFLRSLFSMSLQSPTQRLANQSLCKLAPPVLELRCRVQTFETEYHSFDPIRHALDHRRSDVATDFVFGDLEVPVGRFYASVTWRNNCTFYIEDSESLLSSQLEMKDFEFEPSVNQRDARQRSYVPEVGSLPCPQAREQPDIIQPIASAGTFHGYVPTGTSPISTLRNFKGPASDSSSSPPEARWRRNTREESGALPITAPASSGQPINRNPHERRGSIFKAGSLSGSSPLARGIEGEPSASSQSATKIAGGDGVTHTRKPSTLTQGMAASLRGGPQIAAEQAASSSPKPAGSCRFSSSFSGINQHRRSKPSMGSDGASKAGHDDQGSSGKQSLSSSVAQPGSGLLAEPGGSSGSLQQDQDDISEFLKALDSKKTLQSFDVSKRGRERSTAGQKTTVQLTKFHLMRDSNTALTESMSSSTHLQRSSSSSSRQLTSVPGMVPASLSTASSPGKPLSPHTPHTPAIPSRLSENSIIDYTTTTVARTRPADIAIPETSSEGTNPIDIPHSPRVPHGGRASSAAVRDRSLADGGSSDAAFAPGRRSMSVGDGSGDPPTLSTLLNRNEAETATTLSPAGRVRSGAVEIARHRSSSMEKDEKPPGGLLTGVSASPRRRYTGLGRGQTPPPGGSGSGSAQGSAQGSRYGIGLARSGAPLDAGEDELLLFDMSEIGQGRRSMEEGRGGGIAGSPRMGDRTTLNKQSRPW